MSQQTPEATDRTSDDAVLPHWHKPQKSPLNIVDGDGARVYTADGDEYLDFSSQLICTNAGHSNQAIIDSMSEQLQRIPYVASGNHNDTRTELANRLVEIGPDSLNDVFFSISGSDAVEAAVHLARAAKDAPKILTRYRSYHGSTYGAGGLTTDPATRNALEKYSGTTNRAHFVPPMSYRSPFNADTPEELAEQAADHVEFVIKNEGPDSIAAILTEPIAGSSGAFTAPPGYFHRLRDLCDEYDIYLISDEVMTGFGRCGDWFGIQTEDVQPDMLTFAKGVTSSYSPLAGVMMNDEIGSKLRNGGIEIGQTWGGHPVSCAAGVAAIEEYENGLIDNVRQLAPVLKERLMGLQEKHDVVGDVRGRGFHWAVEFTDPETGEPFFDNRFEEGADPVLKVMRTAAKDHNVMFGPGKPSFHLMVAPPFCIDESDIDEAVEAFDSAISKVFC